MSQYDSELQTPSPHAEPLDPERIDTAGVVFEDVEPEAPPEGDWRTNWSGSPEQAEQDEAIAAYQAEQIGGGASSSSSTFDPGEHTVDDVVLYVDEHPDQLDAVFNAEQAGKARSTLLSQLDAMRG